MGNKPVERPVWGSHLKDDPCDDCTHWAGRDLTSSEHIRILSQEHKKALERLSVR